VVLTESSNSFYRRPSNHDTTTTGIVVVLGGARFCRFWCFPGLPGPTAVHGAMPGIWRGVSLFAIVCWASGGVRAEESIAEAFERLNVGAFVVTMPERLAQVRIFLDEEMLLPPERGVIVPAVNKAELEMPNVLANLTSNGTLDWFWVYNFTGRWYESFSPTRGAVGLSHLRAHRMFLASQFSVAFFFEDDAALSTRWHGTGGRGEFVITSRIMCHP